MLICTKILSLAVTARYRCIACVCLTSFILSIHAAIECEPLPVIANGVITYAPNSVSNYSLGTTATYSCTTGFSLDLSAGSETRICIDDSDNDVEGVFNGQAPTCVRMSTGYTIIWYTQLTYGQ